MDFDESRAIEKEIKAISGFECLRSPLNRVVCVVEFTCLSSFLV